MSRAERRSDGARGCSDVPWLSMEPLHGPRQETPVDPTRDYYEADEGTVMASVACWSPVAQRGRLKQWSVQCRTGVAHFFTCARPGRSKGKNQHVSDKDVSRWVDGLPGPRTAIISLLGRKGGPEGPSEFSFYSFFGGLDTAGERLNWPSFQEWLNNEHAALGILIKEHPTFDFCRIPDETLQQVADDLSELLREQRTVVVVDSGGDTRTNMVCKYLSANEDSRKL